MFSTRLEEAEARGALDATVERLERMGSLPSVQQTVDEEERKMLGQLGWVDG